MFNLPLLRIATIGVIVMMAVMWWTGRPMGPGGILCFEFAGTLQNADEIMGRWGERGRVAALLHTRLDFIFILFYASWGFLSLRSLGAGEPLKWLRDAARFLSYAMLMAGVMDIFENLCMIQVMGDSRLEFYPRAAWWLAGIKFVCISMSLLLMLVLWGRKQIEKISGSRTLGG